MAPDSSGRAKENGNTLRSGERCFIRYTIRQLVEMIYKTDSSNALFREVQHFRQVWLWILLIGLSLVSFYGFIQQLILGEPFGSNPAPDAALVVIMIVVGLGFPAFFYVLNLTTEVRSDGLYVRFFPLHKSFRRIAFEGLRGYELRAYSPIREYGGWGIRFGSRGMAYNVAGDRGVQLEFLNGRRLLIGSQRPEELIEALDLASKAISL